MWVSGRGQHSTMCAVMVVLHARSDVAHTDMSPLVVDCGICHGHFCEEVPLSHPSFCVALVCWVTRGTHDGRLDGCAHVRRDATVFSHEGLLKRRLAMTMR